VGKGEGGLNPFFPFLPSSFTSSGNGSEVPLNRASKRVTIPYSFSDPASHSLVHMIRLFLLRVGLFGNTAQNGW